MAVRRKMLEERAIALANYCVKNNATVRQIAEEFSISKSTVHKDLTERIPQTKRFEKLRLEVEDVLENNKKERHYRGGAATKRKYQNLRKKKKK